MSIFTSIWFWILVIGILLTIGGVIAWAVTGKADILVGILLGAGVGWIIAGLIMWIFGRPKKVPDLPPVPEFPQVQQPMLAGQPTTVPKPVPQQDMASSQQRLMQLLQSNPQLVNYATGASPSNANTSMKL